VESVLPAFSLHTKRNLSVQLTVDIAGCTVALADTQESSFMLNVGSPGSQLLNSAKQNEVFNNIS